MQPAEFDDMDYEEGADLANRVMKLHQDDMEILGQMLAEHAKAVMKAVGMRIA